MTESIKVFSTTTHPGTAFDLLSGRFQFSNSGSNEPISAESLTKHLRGQDAVLSVLQDKFDDALFVANPRLKAVANVAVGFDNIDIAAASRHGVLVINTPGVLDTATADFAFALLLATARRLVEADKYVRARKWKHWTSDLMLGADVGGKTIGIVGLGRIGQAMARRARGFDMKVVYSQNRRANDLIEKELQATYLSLEELLYQADFISVHCPLNEQTRHLIGEHQFAMMKSQAILINTARGPVVDEAALVAALKAGRIRGAGLDVFEREPIVSQPLLEMDNVVLAPHIGSATVETRSAMARLAASGLVSAFAGELPANAVNPECWDTFAKRLRNELCC